MINIPIDRKKLDRIDEEIYTKTVNCFVLDSVIHKNLLELIRQLRGATAILHDVTVANIVFGSADGYYGDSHNAMVADITIARAEHKDVIERVVTDKISYYIKLILNWFTSSSSISLMVAGSDDAIKLIQEIIKGDEHVSTLSLVEMHIEHARKRVDTHRYAKDTYVDFCKYRRRDALKGLVEYLISAIDYADNMIILSVIETIFEHVSIRYNEEDYTLAEFESRVVSPGYKYQECDEFSFNDTLVSNSLLTDTTTKVLKDSKLAQYNAQLCMLALNVIGLQAGINNVYANLPKDANEDGCKAQIH